MKITLTILILVFCYPCLHAQNYCIPQTQAYCCGYGILSVMLPNVNQSSGNASEGYQNFSSIISSGIEGSAFNISITTGGIEPHDVRVWLDANNDGILQHPQEMVFESLNVQSPNGTLNIPANVIFSDTLRLRITADYAGSDPHPCAGPTFGQTEDYSLIIHPAGNMPTAAFTASKTNTCNGIVLFTSQSTGNPVDYQWDFGDGHTSTDAMYTHVYSQDGIYDVRLIVSNSLGADTLLMPEYITVTLSETCDTFAVPSMGNYSVLYNCHFVLTDNGSTENYVDNSNGYISISPLWAQKVCLHFSQFEIEQEFDYIEIFDGPSPASPFIGKYTGNTLPPDVCSTGPALCVKQHSDDVVNYAGFTAQANCTMGVEEIINDFSILVYPNPFTETFTVAFQKEDSYTVSLVSITGKTLFSKNITGGNYCFSLKDCSIPTGIYVLYINTCTGVWQQKIIKSDP